MARKEKEEEYHLVGSRWLCRRGPTVGAVCYGLNFTKGTSLQLKHLSHTHSAYISWVRK